MITDDTFLTLAEAASGLYTEKRSKFISHLHPVASEEEAMAVIDQYRKKYYDARHVCWAYRLGLNGEQTRANDDGEPSGTAGKPILGRLVAADLTNVVAVVVRYFGGVKLGTGGLGVAYRTAVEEALSTAQTTEVILTEEVACLFGYTLMGEVMRIVKEQGIDVLEQDFRESCRLRMRIRAAEADTLRQRLEGIYGVTLETNDQN